MVKTDFTKLANQRPNYFPGQYLLEDDFELQHKYLSDRQHYHNQSLHISGIIEGLEVEVIQDKKAVQIKSGSAINNHGELIVLKEDLNFADFKDITNGELYIQYFEDKQVKQQEDIADSYTRWIEKATLGFAATTPDNGVKLAKLTISESTITLDANIREYSGISLPNSNGNALTLRSGGNTNPNLAVLTGSLKIDGNLKVAGEIRAENSDLYFTKTDHNHSTIGNTKGFAAIENAANFDALMILGRAGTSKNRLVRLWDYLQVNGGMDITGNLGIGTDDPGSYRLNVQGNQYLSGGLTVKETISGAKLQIINTNQNAAGDTLILGPTNQSNLRLGYNQNYSWIQSHGSKPLAINPSGNNVGIGTNDPGDYRLNVQGNQYLSGDLTIQAGKVNLAGNQQIVFTDTDVSNNLKLQLNSGYGLGINDNTLFYTANGKHSWRDAQQKERMSLTTGANGGLTVTGTGTSSFAGNLTVAGAITPSAGNSETNGIMFPLNPFGGSGDAAWIRYYRRGTSGEATTFEIGTKNDPDDHIALMPGNGNVGIGMTNPGAKLSINGGLHVGGDSDPGDNNLLVDGNVDIKGVMSGAANDYQKAQFTMSGGGKVTWDGIGGRLKWTQRFIAISMEKGVTFASGYIDMYQPTKDIPAENVYDGNPRSANADGVILKGWEALYAVHTIGGNNTVVSYRIVQYPHAFDAPSNWLLVAVVNGDDNTIKLGTGVIISAKSSSDRGSPLPSGTILMWSGQVANIPDGWALCNGENSTPNLIDRFIVGAGKSYQPGNEGGENSITLNLDQIPSHEHSGSIFGAGDHVHAMKFDTGGGGNFGGGDMPKTRDPLTSAIANFVANTNSAGHHTHGVRIGSQGGNQAHENRPPYYALCLIMKL